MRAFPGGRIAALRERYGNLGADVIGPAPPFRSKVQDSFRQVMLVKHADKGLLLEMGRLLRECAGERIQMDIF